MAAARAALLAECERGAWAMPAACRRRLGLPAVVRLGGGGDDDDDYAAAVEGDALPAHSPVGWGLDQIRLEVLRVNRDLCPGGKRELPAELRARLVPGRLHTARQLISLVPPVRKKT